MFDVCGELGGVRRAKKLRSKKLTKPNQACTGARFPKGSATV